MLQYMRSAESCLVLLLIYCSPFIYGTSDFDTIVFIIIPKLSPWLLLMSVKQDNSKTGDNFR